MFVCGWVGAWRCHGVVVKVRELVYSFFLGFWVSTQVFRVGNKPIYWDFCQNRSKTATPQRSKPELVTSAGAGQRQWPPQEPVYKGVTTEGVGPSQRPHHSSLKPATSAKADPREWVQREQPQTSNLHGSKHKWTLGLQSKPLGALRNLWEHQVTSRVTATMALTVPWEVTIWALDPPGRLITRHTAQNTPIKGKDR